MKNETEKTCNKIKTSYLFKFYIAQKYKYK